MSIANRFAQWRDLAFPYSVPHSRCPTLVFAPFAKTGWGI